MEKTTARWEKFLISHPIDKTSKIPLYVQLTDILIKLIESSILKQHEKLPTEEDLIRIFSLSRTVVRQTLKELQIDGYIYRQHGRGSFVKEKKLNQDLVRFYSFTEEMKRLGKNPSSVLLDFKKIPTNIFLKKMLAAEENEVYAVTRLRLADGKAIYYETSYLPCSRFKNLAPKHFKKGSMYDMFFNTYNIRLLKAEEIFSAELMPKEAIKTLKLASHEIGIKLERIAFDKFGIVEYTCSFIPKNKYIYRVILANKTE